MRGVSWAFKNGRNIRKKHGNSRIGSTGLPVLPVIFKKIRSVLRNTFHRTNTGACAAIRAFFGIDPAFPVFFANCFHRTLAVAGSTVDAFIRDFISHIYLSVLK